MYYYEGRLRRIEQTYRNDAGALTSTEPCVLAFTKFIHTAVRCFCSIAKYSLHQALRTYCIRFVQFTIFACIYCYNVPRTYVDLNIFNIHHMYIISFQLIVQYLKLIEPIIIKCVSDVSYTLYSI